MQAGYFGMFNRKKNSTKVGEDTRFYKKKNMFQNKSRQLFNRVSCTN